MHTYWIKIILGALGIFAAGMVVRSLVRKVSHEVRVVTETSDPISIPLPFGIVPFNLDGVRLGAVRSLRVLRDSPRGVTALRFRVELGDSADPGALRGCLLTVEDPTRLNERTSFTCLRGDTAGRGLVDFGAVELEHGLGEFPLLLPGSVVADLRSERGAAPFEASADSFAAAADRAAEEAGRVADSIADVNLSRADSIREDALRRADSVREAGMRLADSIRQAKSRGRP